MNTEDQTELFPPNPEEQMRRTLHEEKIQLNGTTLRLLRCRNETRHKIKVNAAITVLDDTPENISIGRTRNELVASTYDAEKTKWHDYVRMIVADTQPEAMPDFLKLSKKHIERLLPKYQSVDKVERNDCVTVSSFEAFAEALQRP